MARAVTAQVLDTQRARYDELLSRLAARRSTTHFAHAAVSLLSGLIFSGAAGKLYWDTEELYLWAVAGFAALGLALVAYSMTRWVLGRRALAWELGEFEKLKALRRELRLDDPSALLP